MENLEDLFLAVKVKSIDGGYRPNKALLLLVALKKCARGEQRLASFSDYEMELKSAPGSFSQINLVYPFGRLLSDGVWDIPDWSCLSKTNSGDLYRSELIEKQVVGGFTLPIFERLRSDSALLRSVSRAVTDKFFTKEDRSSLVEFFDFGVEHFRYDIGAADGQGGALSWCPNKSTCTMDEPADAPLRAPINNFIGYLNSLHNLSAGGANALAESQALSRYFTELYEPFPLVERLKSLLTETIERVVILTGHAGDGKSTVAVDVFKEMEQIPASSPLSRPLKEFEEVATSAGKLTIVKDMSELSSQERRARLAQSFEPGGSWLIISNTGPLVNSLVGYAKQQGLGDIESRTLRALDAPVDVSALSANELKDFGKPLLILNMTRLDNVALGARLLTKLVRHSGWNQCSECAIESFCPIAVNRRALLESGLVTEDRLRWIYRRINEYEQRVTLRQMLAQLAFGLTGGLGCAEAMSEVTATTSPGVDRATAALQGIIFSEGFYGYRRGKRHRGAESLLAVRLLRQSQIGGPVAANFEQAFAQDAGGGWAILPPALSHLAALWQKRAGEPEGVPARASLRRMALMFGTPRSDRNEEAALFLDSMLRSPSVREFDSWQKLGEFAVSRSEQKRLRSGCLNVIREAFSGFSSGQFGEGLDNLYLTLRRPDRAVVQLTQLIIAEFPFRDFDLEFDPVCRSLQLAYRHAPVSLKLPLPLLDFIRRRDQGEVSSGLSPIQLVQLDRFQAELLEVSHKLPARPGEIAFLRAGINGEVGAYRYFLDEQERTLEKE